MIDQDGGRLRYLIDKLAQTDAELVNTRRLAEHQAGQLEAVAELLTDRQKKKLTDDGWWTD